MTKSKIDVIVAKLNKQFNADVCVKAIDVVHKPRITTGSLVMDVAMGGGWQTGTWSEIVGFESHGKTVVALQTVAANQVKNPDFITCWVAAEPYDAQWAETNGVDNERVWLIETTSLEEAADAIKAFMEAHVVDLVVVDSLPALSPLTEDEAESFEDFPVIGRAATLWGRIFRQTNKLLREDSENERPMTALVINQWRDIIGAGQYQDPRISPGGKAKNYFYAMRIDVTRDGWIEHGTGTKKKRVGQGIKIKTIKNKTYPPQQTAMVDFYFRSTDKNQAGRYDFAKEVVSQAVLWGILKRKAAWYYYGSEKWNGANAVVEAVKESPELFEQLTDEVMFMVTHVDSQPGEIDDED